MTYIMKCTGGRVIGNVVPCDEESPARLKVTETFACKHLLNGVTDCR